jgi:4-hydroxy-3-polyprenylbenzoate decarboxylase
MRLVVAVTGASGALYAVRLLKACLDLGLRIELVVSDYGRRLLIDECGLNLKTEDVPSWLDRTYGPAARPGTIELHPVHDLGDALASGSQSWDAMVIVPCSMKTLAGVAHGSSTNLIERAADVTLKEGRPLVLVPRECPLSLIHLENLTRAARAGARIVPAMPAFYFGPRGLDDLADFVAGRALSVLGIRHALYAPWDG